MLKRKYTYFYCVECVISAGNFVKLSSVKETDEKINADNYIKIQSEIEEVAMKAVKAKFGYTPQAMVITSLSCLHEEAEAPLLTLLRGKAGDEGTKF